MAITSLANTMWRINNIDSYDGNDVTAHISCHYELRTISNVIYTDMTGFSFSKETLLGHQDDEFKPLPYATKILVGDKIKFLGNAATDTSLINRSLINWFTANATPIDQEEYEELNPPQVNCKVNFDYDLIQDDCHWNLDRYFRFTFKVLDERLLKVSPEFYYRFGDFVDLGGNALANYAQVPNSYLIYNNGNTWIYHLRVSDINKIQLANLRDTAGNLKVTALIRVSGNIAYETFSQYLELPPTLAATKSDSELPNVQTDYVKANPGEFVCTWSPATVVTCGANEITGVDTVDGYSIEVFRQPEGSKEILQIKGLTWDTFELACGVYKLIKDPSYYEADFTESSDLTKDFSLKSNHTRSEVRIENPLKTEFFFIPKTLGILPGDSYQIRIYPYSHFEGVLISTKGTASDGIDVPKGIVRVKTASGWVEGQVWVMTESGWKNAEVIYTKTADGWKEAI